MKTTTALLTLAFGLSAYTTLAQPQPEGESAPGARQGRMEGMGRHAGGPPPWAGMGQRRPDTDRPVGRQFAHRQERSAGPEFGYGMRNRARSNGSVERARPGARGSELNRNPQPRMQRQRQNGMERRQTPQDGFDRPGRRQGLPAMNARGSGQYVPGTRGQTSRDFQRPAPAERGQRGPRAWRSPEENTQSPTMRNGQGQARQQRQQAGRVGREGGQFRRGANLPRGPHGGWNRPNDGTAPNAEPLPQPRRERQGRPAPEGEPTDNG